MAHGQEIMSPELEESPSPPETSSRSITPEPSNNDFSRLERTGVPSKSDETAASLERLLQAERDHRNEERFFWIFALTIITDVLFFKFLDSALVSVPLFLLEIVFLIGLAGWLGV